MIPVSTIQTIPAYGTQTVPIYDNALNPSISLGVASPLVSTTNYGTTSVPTSFIQVPVTNPVKPTESMISLAHSQLSIPANTSVIPAAPIITPQPRGLDRIYLFNCTLPSSAYQIKPNYVSNYPIDENDPRRLPRYAAFTLPMIGSNLGMRTGVAQIMLHPTYK